MRWALTGKRFISGPYTCWPGTQGWTVCHGETPLARDIPTLIDAKAVAKRHAAELAEKAKS